jgi:hypothetical protein
MDSIEAKIEELADKYCIPKQMLTEAIELEKSKVILSRRTKMTSSLMDLMGKHLAEFERLNENHRDD